MHNMLSIRYDLMLEVDEYSESKPRVFISGTTIIWHNLSNDYSFPLRRIISSSYTVKLYFLNKFPNDICFNKKTPQHTW